MFCSSDFCEKAILRLRDVEASFINQDEVNSNRSYFAFEECTDHEYIFCSLL